MKICPQCRQTYSDDGLNFCLNDGSVLDSQSATEARTMVFEQPRLTNEFPGAQHSAPPSVWQAQQSVQPARYGSVSPRIGNTDRSLGIISILLGIFSIILGCFLIGIPLGVGAIVTGGIAIRNENNEPERYGGRGLAIGGVVTGAVGLAIGLIFAVLYMVT